MRRDSLKRGVTESFVSIFLLAMLGLIAVGIFIKQFRYDPADFGISEPTEKSADNAANLSILEFPAPDGYKASAKSEIFNPDSLYNKIDGKADLYLASGFKNLYCRIFTNISDPAAWMEIFIYDMDTPKNALAVFGQQKRPDGLDIATADFAYKTPDAVFLAKGKYYVEISGSAASEQLVAKIEELAVSFVKSVGAAAGQIEELAIFPKDGLVPQSFKLYISGAYGYEGFRDLYSAKYNIGGSQTTAFLCKLPDKTAAEKLAADYRKFLIDNGGTEKPSANKTLNGIFDMGGEFEAVFAKDDYVGGVHGAETPQAAEAVAIKILENLTTDRVNKK